MSISTVDWLVRSLLYFSFVVSHDSYSPHLAYIVNRSMLAGICSHGVDHNIMI